MSEDRAIDFMQPAQFFLYAHLTSTGNIYADLACQE